MKICLINNLYKPFNRGGAEKVSETIVAGLRQAGYDVFIITTKPYDQLPINNYALPYSSLTPRDKRIYYLNSYYYNLNKLPEFLRLFWQIFNLFNIFSYFKIKKILTAEKCDAVITNNLMGVGFLTPLAIRSLKIKHLHIAHDIQLLHPSGLMYYGEEGIINNFFAKVYADMCRWLFNTPQAVIFPSNWLKDFYLKRNFFKRSRIVVLPNPVEIAPKRAGECSGNFKFLFLGQIEKHKGVFLLVDAFNKIKEKYPDVELLLAGDGSQLESARKQAAGDANIKFLGWPGDEEANKLLGVSDCLVYPSLVYENCPNAIQRALAAGLPVIGSNLGGIPELLNYNSRLLFEPADVNDLASKIALMIENKNNPDDLAGVGINIASEFKAENYINELVRCLKT